ncbi:MAG: tricarboxylate transporter [Alphaproteobacteria bacterium]|nr:tricarboxylate transporter [Alphaproteobacteria bacterium]
MIDRRRLLASTAAGAAALALPGLPRRAEAQSFEFAGTRIELVVPFGEGGGTDVWARVMLPHLKRHMPGDPSLIVRNIPGGGAITGSNEFQRRARPDGLTLFALSSSVITNYVFRDRRVQYKPEEWIPVMVSPLGAVAYAAPSLGIRSPADIAKLRGQTLRYGSNGATSVDITLLLAIDLLGFELQPAFGMNRGPARLAFERGETNLDHQTTAAYIAQSKPLVDAGRAVPLFSFGYMQADESFTRDPTFPDIPSFTEAYRTVHGRDPSGPGYEAWKTLFHATVTASKAFMLPAGTPAPIVTAYRAAATAMVNDETFKREASKEIGVYPQAVGDVAVRQLRLALTMPDEARAYLTDWLRRKYNVTLPG